MEKGLLIYTPAIETSYKYRLFLKKLNEKIGMADFGVVWVSITFNPKRKLWHQ